MKCECGCGQETQLGRRFRWGHNLRVQPTTPARGPRRKRGTPWVSLPCACGCGRNAHPGNRFVHGHNVRGVSQLESQRRNIARAKLGDANPMKRTCLRENKAREMRDNWQREDFVRKQMQARGIVPNKVEVELLRLLGPDWKFVGDGQLIIGGKCPDFANVNGKKELIELFGRYWHKPEEEQPRIDHFSEFGFRTLVIWEEELQDEQKLLERVRVF